MEAAQFPQTNQVNIDNYIYKYVNHIWMQVFPNNQKTNKREREGERDVCYTSLDAWLFKTSKSNKKDISRFVGGCKSSPNNPINIDIYIYTLSMFGCKRSPTNFSAKGRYLLSLFDGRKGFRNNPMIKPREKKP